MDTFFNFIFQLIEDNIVLTYLFFFISNALQYLFPPFPSDVLQAVGGYALYFVKNFNPFILFIILLAGSISGVKIIYWIGKTLEHKFLESRIVKMMFKPEQIENSKKHIKKYGMFAVFITKFIPGINVITILLAGITKLNYRKTIIAASLSCIIHHIAVISLGYLIALETHEYIADFSKIKGRMGYYTILMTVIAIGIIILFVLGVIIKNKYLNRKEVKKGLSDL